MAVIKNIEFEDGILSVKLTGNFSILSSKSNFIKILESAAEYKSQRILIDTTETSNSRKSRIDAMEYGKFIAEMTLSLEIKRLLSRTKIAYVHLPAEDEMLKLGELVAGNRGLKAKSFLDSSDAINWLKK